MTHSYQFVSQPVAGASVLLDLDDVNPFSVQESSSVSPPKLQRSTARGLRDGTLETGSSYLDRTVKLVLKVAEVATETQSTALQTLGRILNQPDGAWLKWQSEGSTQPVFLRTKRADYDVLDRVADATPVRGLTFELDADPFAYGLPVTGTATIANDPTAATNPMSFKFPAIQGDVETPLKLSFPTPDAAHRVVIASNSLLAGTPPSIADMFNRANSTSAPGTTPLGALAWAGLGGGTWGINSKQLYLSAGTASTYSILYVDAGVADGTVEVLFPTLSTSGTFAGLWFRGGASNATGYMMDHLGIWRSGTTSMVTFSTAFASGDRARVVMSGSTFTIYRQAGGVGAWTQVGTFTDSTYNSNTRVGVNVYHTGTTNRFDQFVFTPAAKVLPSQPYWRPFTADVITTSPELDWTVTDVADANSVNGTVRRVNHFQDVNSEEVSSISLDTYNQWPLPPGDYKMFLRSHAYSLNLSLHFSNVVDEYVVGPPGVGTAVRDWQEMSKFPIAMPGGAPPLDPYFDSAPKLAAAPYGNVMYADDDGSSGFDLGSVDLDGMLAIPCSRPGLISKFLTLDFDALYQSKTMIVDGSTDEYLAIGRYTAAAPDVDLFVRPTRISGAAPVVVPGADNMLFFMATVSDESASRAADSKSTTTVVTYTYWPRYLYADRPAST